MDEDSSRIKELPEEPAEETGPVPEMPFDPTVRVRSREVDSNFRETYPLFRPQPIEESEEANRRSSDDEDDANPESVRNSEPPPPEIPMEDPGPELPEWRRITLPPIPVPDDREIDAEILARYDIGALIQQIRGR
jgi:hypothetical protein